MGSGEKESTSTKFEVRLSAPDLEYFDALRGDTSRQLFATMLITYALDYPEEAFAVQIAAVRKKFGRKRKATPPGAMDAP